MRSITRFVCQQCGYSSPQWLGRCPQCESWNSLVEEVEEKNGPERGGIGKAIERKVRVKKLGEIKLSRNERLSTGFTEMDRVLGGGVVLGSVILLSGDPGIGKSTLFLQVIGKTKEDNPLYVSGEESLEQVKLRVDRLSIRKKDMFLLSSNSLEEAIEAIRKTNPSVVVIDSIQTIASENLTGTAGSVGQVRECTARLIEIAKKKRITMLFIGHVTKEGMIAGPQVLSHLVDTVLFLEGERFREVRILRSLKNRFGPVDEVGVFTFDASGFSEVKNPSDLFLPRGKKAIPGSVVVSTIEGTRPILVELQGLVLPSKLAFPRRVVSGVSLSRVELLLAVLQKQADLPLDRLDVFVNVAGGLRLSEPGVDLGICLAIASSLKNVALPSTVAIGELGLLGEVRAVQDLDKREREARKLGFKTIISARNFANLEDVLKRGLAYGKERT